MVDTRPSMPRDNFVRRVITAFPDATIERHASGELVVYTGWYQGAAGDTVLRQGEET